MKENFYSYLDGFNRVTIIYPKKRGYNTKQKACNSIIELHALLIWGKK